MAHNNVSSVSRIRKSSLRRTHAELEELKKIPSDFNRYLDLFTQLNIIEDSFEFVQFIFHFDPFQCVYAGSSFEKIYGHSCKDIYNNTNLFYEVAHPEDSDFLMQQIKILLKNSYHEFTYRIITKNSEVKYLKTNAWYQQDEGQSFIMTCFQKDITVQMESGNNLKKSLQKQHLISDIAITLNSIDDFGYKLQQVINKIGCLVQADQLSIYEISNEQKQMVCRCIWTKQDPIIPQGLVVKIPPLNHLPEYINTLQYLGGDPPDGFMRCWNIPEQVQSIMLVPVRIKQKMFGFIELVSIKKRRWKDVELSFICTIGNMMANFYDRKSINDELNLNYLYQELLANISYRLNQHTDDNKNVLKTVLGHIGMSNPGTERVFIYVFDEDNYRFKKLFDYVNPSLNPKFSSQDEYDGALFANIIPTLKSGMPYHTTDVSKLGTEMSDLFKSLYIKSFLAVPMFVDGKFYGIYGNNVYSHYHVWKKSEIEITQSFASCISHFIERQLIMKRLKNSEKKIKDISSKLPGCVFQVALSPNEDLALEYISPQFEQWSGIKPTSKTSLRKLQQTIHPNNHDAFFKIKKELERLQPEISFEGRFFFPNIGFKWLIVKASLLEIKASGELTYNGLLIDITESKQIELKLADANVSIQSIINNLESGVLLVDDYNNVLYSNEKLEEMLVSELDVTNNPSKVLDATFDLVKDNATLRDHTRDLMKKRIEERDKELFFNKTAEFYTRYYIPVFREHKFFAHLFIFNNVTHTKLQDIEVQKSYKRVRTIIDYSDIGVVLLSENEKVMIVNEKFLKLFQIKEPASYFVNQWFRILWDKMDENVRIDGVSREQIRDSVYSGTRISNHEIMIDDSTIQCFIEPVVYDNQMQKDTHETLIQLIDVTTQRNVEQTLRKAKEEAETTANTRSHILASMSHEIRTPLNGILGFSGMLKEMLEDPYHREMAEVIDQSGRRLLDTMDAILDYSMVQSETKSFKVSMVNVNRLIHEQINDYKATALQKELYLYAEIKGVIGINIAGRMMNKMLSNLVKNAIKYTITGGVKVEAGIIRVEDNDWLDLKVIDTGVGIDEFKHKTIFEPFRQESEGYGRAFEGTGLGLSLVKEYVLKMGGKIFLASRKDEGSTFTILLPQAYYDNNDMSSEIIGLSPEENKL